VIARRAALATLACVATAACSTTASDRAVAAGAVPASAERAAPRGEWELVYDHDFLSEDALADFEFTDANAWRWSDAGGHPSLELVGGSRYAPPHRSPLNIALARELELGDFALEVDLLQTGREYGHRDLCLFFGYTSPAHFYYVHLATTPDDHANNIFVVNGAPRVRAAQVPAQGVEWGEGSWHTVRLERSLASGTIRVFFDDMETPVLETKDTTHGWGRIGFGSFDDSGRFARVRVWAPEVRVASGVAFE